MEVRYLAHAKQMMALERIPQIAAEFEQRFGRDTGGLVRGYRLRGRRDHRRGAGLGARHAQGHGRRAARATGQRSACSASPRSGPSRWPRCAPRCRAPSAWWCWRRASRWAWAASSPPTCGWRCRACSCTATPWSPGWAGAPSPRPRCARMLREAMADQLEPLTFLDLDWRIVNRQLEREAQMRRSGPIAENLLRDVGTVASESELTMTCTRQVLPDRHLHRRQPPAGARAAQRAGQHRAHQLAQLRPPRLPGLRRGAGRALRDRRRDARHRQPADRGQRHRLPGGVLHALPRDLVAAAVDPLAVRQCRGGGHRHRRGAEGQGQQGRPGAKRRARARPGRRRRHHRHRLRLPVGHVRAQRRRALHLLRQRGLHEHRRAAQFGHAAGGAHGHHHGGGRRARAPSSARARTCR